MTVVAPGTVASARVASAHGPGRRGGRGRIAHARHGPAGSSAWSVLVIDTVDWTSTATVAAAKFSARSDMLRSVSPRGVQVHVSRHRERRYRPARRCTPLVPAWHLAMPAGVASCATSPGSARRVPGIAACGATAGGPKPHLRAARAECRGSQPVAPRQRPPTPGSQSVAPRRESPRRRLDRGPESGPAATARCALPFPAMDDDPLAPFRWHPEPELIGIRDAATSRAALERVGEATWRASPGLAVRRGDGPRHGPAHRLRGPAAPVLRGNGRARLPPPRGRGPSRR